jgi:7,8-dihydropterin-6-yl-methyl-4-(beta-D-ribofuranosyl)aminobenzene 5'-phosphate synthase
MDRDKGTTAATKTVEPADGVDVTVLVDNIIDSLLKSSPGISRFRDRNIEEPLLAEHGLSLLIEITHRGEKKPFLLDTGSTGTALAHNAEKMGINLKGIAGIFISHNHKDHTTGLETVLARTGPVPVFIHPYGFYTKWVKSRRNHLEKDRLAGLGAQWQAQEGPQTMSPFLLTTGTVPRVTDFEEILGEADRRVEKDGSMEPEKFLDDGALVMNVKGKGIVVVTGCAHSGIINTLERAQQLGGNDKIYAVIGGFHLTQGSPERLKKTIRALKEMEIRYLLPLHCTGFEAMSSMWQAFPETYVIPSVGTRIEI